MSAQFKPGDVCVVVASPCTSEIGPLLGKECTVVSQIPQAFVILLTNSNHPHYELDFGGGMGAVLCGHCLRKKQPPAEQGSWLAIEKITGWVPKKKPEAVPA